MRGLRGSLARAVRVAALSALGIGSPSLADNFVFDNQIAGGDWHATQGTTTNWAPEGLPGAADNASINGFHVTIGREPVSLAQLHTSGGSLTVGQNLTISNSGSIANLHLGRDLIANGSVSVFGNSDWNLGVITGASGVTNNGTFTSLSPPPGQVTSLLNSSFTNQGTFHCNASFRVDNSIFRNNATFNLNTALIGLNNPSFVNTADLTTAVGTANLAVPLLNTGIFGMVSAAGSAANLTLSAGSEFLNGGFRPSGGGVISLVGTAPHVISGSV